MQCYQNRRAPRWPNPLLLPKLGTYWPQFSPKRTCDIPDYSPIDVVIHGIQIMDYTVCPKGVLARIADLATLAIHLRWPEVTPIVVASTMVRIIVLALSVLSITGSAVFGGFMMATQQVRQLTSGPRPQVANSRHLFAGTGFLGLGPKQMVITTTVINTL